MAEQTGPVWYEIRVRGVLGKTLLGAFPGMCARAHETDTVLCGPVADQAALHGVRGGGGGVGGGGRGGGEGEGGV